MDPRQPTFGKEISNLVINQNMLKYIMYLHDQVVSNPCEFTRKEWDNMSLWIDSLGDKDPKEFHHVGMVQNKDRAKVPVNLDVPDYGA